MFSRCIWCRLPLVLMVFIGATLLVETPNGLPLVSDPGASQRIEWWREARFGMFLHWGVSLIRRQENHRSAAESGEVG